MTKYIDLKTTRTRKGKARATLSRFIDFSGIRCYSFGFYNIYKTFNTHKELRSYILETYGIDIGDKKTFWGW